MKPTDKSLLRHKMKNLLEEYSEELNIFSLKISEKLIDLMETKKWQRVGLFAPLETEPNIWPVFEHFSKKIEFYFPRTDRDSKLEYIGIQNKGDLMKGLFGILEPHKKLPPIDPSTLDALFIPGVAFDQQGNRLGRGKGFYDRFLTQLPKKVVKVGICFPFQVIETVPTETQDQKVDFIIS